MNYQLAFRYALDRRDGFTNLLLMTVCQFIPVLGPVVLLGYRAEVAVALDRDPEMKRHPKFDFNKLVEYLNRGLWPFLTSLLLALPLIPLVLLAIVVGLLVDPPGLNHPPVAAFVCGGMGYAFGLILYFLLAGPMVLYTELIGQFDLGGAFRFALGFWKLMAAPAVLAWLAFMFLAAVVVGVGLLCCFVGVYPASTLVQMAGQHLMVQLYREYVARGGEPVPEALPTDRDDDADEGQSDDRW